MKKITTYILFSLICLTIAAQDLTSVFLNIPESVLLGLDAENKDRLINTSTDSISATATSLLGGDLVRKAISDDYILIETSSAGTLQIKLLPLVNNSKIVCVVKTVCGKACDSNIEFYTTDWVLLPKSSLFPKTDINWFIKEEADKQNDDLKNAIAALNMVPVKILLDDSSSKATLTLDLENYLSKADLEKVKDYINESPKILSWDKVSFK